MSPGFVVHHLGRAGEHAGGMTQVVNGYLSWPFAEAEVRVIVSRGDPHEIVSAATRSANAATRILRLPRAARQVVVAHLSERGSFLREGSLLRLANARGIPTIAHLHGSSFAEFAERHPRLVAQTLRSADRVVSLSAESSEVSARFVDRERIVLVPNAIPPGAPVAEERLVVFGGVVTRRKGVDVLQEAWRRIAPEGWRLVVAGPIVDADLVRRDIPGIEFAGALDHAELMGLLDRAAVAVLPSREEAMPMFILEALARDCAVVSTDVGGIAAVLGDGVGVVLPPGDADALAAAVRTLLDDESARAAYRTAGRRAFDERYSAVAVFPRLEQVWADAADRRPRHHDGPLPKLERRTA